MALRKGWPIMSGRLLELSKVVEKRLWGFEHPLRQFPMLRVEVLEKLERRNLTVDRLKEMEPQEIGTGGGGGGGDWIVKLKYKKYI